MLTTLGYTVTTMQQPLKALELFRRNPAAIDLIITDQTMPNMTGLDLATKILAVRPDLPIVLCTGFGTETTEEKARAAGIHTYIKKPLGPRKLAMVVGKILNPNHPLEVVHGQCTDY